MLCMKKKCAPIILQWIVIIRFISKFICPIWVQGLNNIKWKKLLPYLFTWKININKQKNPS
jgi:hypothetical protein